MIDGLRLNDLSLSERGLLADTLEALWFPSSQQVKDRRAESRASFHRWKVIRLRQEINAIAPSDNISKAGAKLKVVERFKWQSVEALEIYMRRAFADKKDTGNVGKSSSAPGGSVTEMEVTHVDAL